MLDTDEMNSEPQEGQPGRNEITEPAEARAPGTLLAPRESELARDAAATGLAPRVALESVGEILEHHDVARSTTEIRAVREDREVRIMPTVLLVEDSEDFAAIVRETLRRIHVDVAYAPDGRAATEYLHENRPDLILLDLNLPDMTGWSIIDHAKDEFDKLPYVERPRIIVLTAYNDPANRLVGKLQEVYRFLVKTTTPIELQNIVREALVR